MLNVLLIEDDPDDRIVVRHLITKITHQPCALDAAATLASGLQKLGDGSFDAVLLDMRLPDTQSLDGLRTVRKVSADLAIVILTGLEDEALAHEALRSGAQDYLIKGRVTSSSLDRALRYAVERIRGERARQDVETLREVNRLALTASHEINNPLTIVLGQLQLMAIELKQLGTGSDRIAPALEAVERIRRIVDLMGRIRRLEMQKSPGTLPEILDLWRSAGLGPDVRSDQHPD